MGITHLIKQEKDIEGRDHHSTISKTEMNLLQAKTKQNIVSETEQTQSFIQSKKRQGITVS